MKLRVTLAAGVRREFVWEGGCSSRSRGDRDDLITHLASGGLQTFETPPLTGLFESGEDAHIKSDPMSDEVPDDAGDLVGHGRNGFGCA